VRDERFVLVPLGPEHNEADHRAWMTSIDHIRATPGFRPELWGGDDWPYPMPAATNLADLVGHAEEFARGEAFAYTVLDPDDGDVLGCVYVDPDDRADARCRLWVRADRAALDPHLEALVRAWLAGPDWGFTAVRFPGRDDRPLGPGHRSGVRADDAGPRP
jgi:hypothetical protein